MKRLDEEAIPIVTRSPTSYRAKDNIVQKNSFMDKLQLSSDDHFECAGITSKRHSLYEPWNVKPRPNNLGHKATFGYQETR